MRSIKLFTTVLCFFVSTTLFAQGSWQPIGPIDFSNGDVNKTSLALHPSSGTPYMAYEDEALGSSILKGPTTVMKYDGSQWTSVGNEGFSDGYAFDHSLAFSPSTEEPYVAYSDNANGGVTVEKFDGNQWVTVGNDSLAAGNNIDLEFSPSGTPYVVTDKEIIKKFDGTQWVQVGSFGLNQDANDLEFGPSGTPYLAFSPYEGATVKKFDGSQWVNVGKKAFSDSSAYNLSLAIGPSGTPNVVYEDNGNWLTAEAYDGNQWAVLGTDSFSDGEAGYPSLATDPGTGMPYIAYDDRTNDGTTVEKFYGGQWVSVGDKGFSNPAKYHSLTIEPSSGTPFVGFKDMKSDQFDNDYGATVMKFGSGGTGISLHQGTEADLKLYPNPANDRVKIVIKSHNKKDTELLLRDPSGRKLKQKRIPQKGVGIVSTDQLSSGIYFLELRNAGSEGKPIAVKKLVVK